MTISAQNLPFVFNAVKDAYQRRVSKAEASRRISQELGVKLSSATNIVGDFATMMTGKAYTRISAVHANTLFGAGTLWHLVATLASQLQH